MLMASISGISSPPAATYPTSDDATTSRVPQKSLGKDDFFKLLAVQFQVQDPMKPMEDTAFIAQMAQFSSLEQSSAMSSEIAQLRSEQKLATANSYLGQNVTVPDGDGGVITGPVSAIEMIDGQPRLAIGEYTYSLSSVLRVEPGTVNPPAPQPVNTGAA